MAQNLIHANQLDVDTIADDTTFINNLAVDTTLLTAFSSGSGFGDSHVWDVTGLSTFTTYQNTSGGPIMVTVNLIVTAGGGSLIVRERLIGDLSWNFIAWFDYATTTNVSESTSVIIPNNHEWQVTNSSAAAVAIFVLSS